MLHQDKAMYLNQSLPAIKLSLYGIQVCFQDLPVTLKTICFAEITQLFQPAFIVVCDIPE
jgi:hypothetical protein